MSAPVPEGTYAEHARTYRALGWNPLPLPPGAKFPPPRGFTGDRGVDPSGADIQAWCDCPEYADTRQTALRMPDGVIGIDIDAYGSKTGGDTLIEAEHRWGSLPSGPWSSARADGVSGILLFRVPAGTVLVTEIGFPGTRDAKGSGGIEIIQRRHRYAVVWPSIHPEGAPYVWHGTAGPGLAPRVDELPELPQTWIDALRRDDVAPTAEAADDATLAAFLERHTAGRRPFSGALTAFGRWTADGMNRHDAMRDAACMAARETAAGQYPAQGVYNALAEAFWAAVRDDGSRSRAAARIEYRSAWRWAVGQLDGLTAEEIRDRTADARRGPWDGAAGQSGGDKVPRDEQAVPVTAMSRFLLPDQVWDFSEHLGRIYQASRARLASPDAMLHNVLVTLASLLHHKSKVHTGKGASVLTSYFAPIAASGGGKDEALKAARDLMDGFIADRFAITGNDGWIDDHLGSGEGMIDAFLGDVQRPLKDPATGNPLLDKDGNQRTEKVRDVVRHNALFADGEGRRVLALDARKGSTLMPRLCDVWSGNAAGERNTEAGGRSRRLPAGAAVVGVVLGFQFEHADRLFEDETGGAPQRFTFASAAYPPHAADIDSEVEDEWPPGGLLLKVAVEPIVVTLDHDQRRYVRRAQRAKAGGVELPDVPNGALDGHRVLLRCRVAALLTILHGDGETELTVPPAVWDLAGLLVDKSCELRDWLAGDVERRRAAAWKARQDHDVQTAARAHEVAERLSAVNRAAETIVAAVHRAEGRTLTTGKARHAARRYPTDVRDAALALAVKDGRLAVTADRKSVTAPEDES